MEAMKGGKQRKRGLTSIPYMCLLAYIKLYVQPWRGPGGKLSYMTSVRPSQNGFPETSYTSSEHDPMYWAEDTAGEDCH